jgi:hypothetical protein
MKTLMRCLILPALAVGFACSVRAQEPEEPGKTGKLLLLKSGHVMEGDIKQVGKQMCVRRGDSEVWIAADKTMRLSPDWLDAYAFMQTLIRPDNANDRVKLARWCHQNHLNTEALSQARFALDIQPNHGDAKQLVILLERALKTPLPTQTPTVVKTTAPPPPTPKVQQTPNVDVTSETMIAFSLKVQPILLNACANCHAGASDSKFRLERVSMSGHKVATQQNLMAVLEQVNLDRPSISPLLVKAVTPHGHEQNAPLKDRSAKPFQSLQQWIVEAIAKNPQLKDYRDAKKPLPKRPEEKPSTFSSERSSAEISVPAPRIEMTALKTAPVAEPRTQTPREERDWCDAAWFNECFHPHGRPQPITTAQR